jgi:hypothetical protein
VTPAYTASAWTGFGTVVATVAATLTGLLFVAVSINLRRILEYPNLPGRAGQTLVMFSIPLVFSILLADPGRPDRHRGRDVQRLGAAHRDPALTALGPPANRPAAGAGTVPG